MKEEFLSIFDEYRSRKEGELLILNWLAEVKFTDLDLHLNKFTKSVRKRLSKILNWFDRPITNAKAEGINNVIKTILKRGYGYKDFDYMRLKVLQKCGTLVST